MPGDDIEPGESVFLLSPMIGEREHALCGDLLDRYEMKETAVLFITLTDTPASRIAFWRDHVGALPSRTSVVHAGAADTTEAPELDETSVRLVPNPGNLTQLGVQITEALDELRAESENIVVCFRSLSALLQYASPNQTFQFMQVLTDHFNQAATVAHVHMNSDAHDRQTIATFTQVFDVVIEVEDDGVRRARI